MQTNILCSSGLDNLLPCIELDFREEMCEDMRGVMQVIENSFERKVITNAGLLVAGSTNAKMAARTLADCLADASGLFVDFSSFGV